LEITKGDKIVRVDEWGYNVLANMADYFEVISIQEVRGMLNIQTKFRYNSDEAYSQGVELSKLKQARNAYFYLNFNFTRSDAWRFIRKYEHQFKIHKP
jgi:hypothetical protein